METAVRRGYVPSARIDSGTKGTYRRTTQAPCFVITIFSVGFTQTIVMGAFAITDNIGAAMIAAFASVINTWLLVRHSRKVDEVQEDVRKRRLVVTRNDSEDVVIISPEERRNMGLETDPQERRNP